MNLEYALRDAKLIHISEVESGLKCSCVCPACGGILIARKGKVTAHHFAHKGAECEYAGETALHMLAKEILEKERKIRLPEVNLHLQGNAESLLYESTEVEFDEVILEKRLNEIVPDVLIRVGKKLLVIEIWVTHKIDDAKLSKLKQEQLSALEIDLSSVDRSITYEDLRDILLGDSQSKNWAYNVVAETHKNEWLKICRKFKTVNRCGTTHIDHCPNEARVWHGKPYANLIYDCWDCECYIHYKQDDYDYDNDEGIVYCCGGTAVKTIDALKAHIRVKGGVATQFKNSRS